MKNSKKLSLDELKVQSFVTNLDAENQKNVMGGRFHDPSHDTHTEFSDELHPEECGCLSASLTKAIR